MTPDIRDITDLAGCRAVVDVQVEVWGRDAETVPSSLLLASIKRGGLLVGAWAGERLLGFVWSMPGLRDGQMTHWSHMLGVRGEAQGRGLGEALKSAQRTRALADGFDLIEWTFDPLQATNAHLNFSCLGAIASEYRVNAYGEMSGPLHRGTPTDRLVAEWWISRAHVERRLAKRTAAGGMSTVDVRGVAVGRAPDAIVARPAGEWIECASVHLDLDAPRLLVAVPPRYSEMQQQATSPALAWRLGARDAFTTYFGRGYRAVDFLLNREQGGGRYLLALDSSYPGGHASLRPPSTCR